MSNSESAHRDAAAPAPPEPASAPALPSVPTLESLNAYRGALAETMGIEFTDISAHHLSARMPVTGNTQPYGILHGGASVVLAETVGSAFSMILAGAGRAAVGMTVSATHHRPAASGHVVATATLAAAGRTTATSLVRITDDAGNPVCTATLLCNLRDAPPTVRT